MKETINLKKSAFSSMVWKFLERILAQGVSIVVSIVLARLLTPDDYGIVSIVAIFFVFANVLISGGLNTSLIQKKDADIEDYSSVLYVSVVLSIVVYAFLFFIAPLIADIYNRSVLIVVIRVMGLTLPINAIKSIYSAYISSTLQFRKFFFATIGGTIVSAIVGIFMALKGFGPWALVAQQMTNAVIDTIILVVSTRIRFVLRISFPKLRILFKYGWKVFVTSLISVSFAEIKPLVIGIRFESSDLSFYSKGESFPKLICSTLTNSFSSVLFPLLAKFQDDRQMILNVVRKFVRLCSYLVFPAMIGLFVVSDNFIIVLLGDAWATAAVYIKIFSIMYLLDIISVANLEAIKAMGDSKTLLVAEIIKKSIFFGIIIIFIILSDSPIALALSTILISVIAAAINVYLGSKRFGYKATLLLKDLMFNLLISLTMGVLVFFVGLLGINRAVVLILQVLAGISFYLFVSVVTKNSSFRYFEKLLKGMLKRKNDE